MCAGGFKLPDAVRKIGAELASKNIAVFPVGGCVRDFLMHREPGDFDLAAQCTPERLRASLEEAGYRLSFEGFDFGTVCVHVGGMTVEITCCRREGATATAAVPTPLHIPKIYTTIWQGATLR